MTSNTPLNAPKVGFVSLGCPKALVDSEAILTRLRGDGYEIVPTYAEADVVVVNTCGFIDSAKAESLQAIGEALDENGKVVVTGCMGARKENILKVHPSVLAVTGPQQTDEVVEEIHRHVPSGHRYDPFTDLLPPQGIKLTPRHYSYLKISEGCNHKCSFCIIPSMRGRLVSRPMADVLDEAKRLADAGVRELLVISQDTSAYGVDLRFGETDIDGRKLSTRMKTLCRELGRLGIWVRLHYVYPYPHVDDVIPMMADGLILPYLDIPFQHGSPRILKLMRRPAAAENTLERIRRWREICPEITLRSTFIVGFPGETDHDFEQLLEFIEAAQLDRVGCFRYSPVAGASANQLADPVPDQLMREREAEFMHRQAIISRSRLQAKTGTVQQVLIDEIRELGAIGRSHADAPEIDGVVLVRDGGHLSPGDMVNVAIDTATEHDLAGQLA
jgi:ribosomal protein S12 methylthiotransferase